MQGVSEAGSHAAQPPVLLLAVYRQYFRVTIGVARVVDAVRLVVLLRQLSHDTLHNTPPQPDTSAKHTPWSRPRSNSHPL